MSAALRIITAANAIQYVCVAPSTIVPIPNTPTAISSALPTFRRNGFIDKNNAIVAAPMPADARSHP